MATDFLEAQLSELRARIEWFDEERRKVAKRLAELEQRVELRTRELQTRDQRIAELERQLTDVKAQLGAIHDFPVQLTQVREETQQLVAENMARRLEAEQEIKRLQRVEHDNLAREIAELKKLPSQVARHETNLEQRQAEEGRLVKLIATLQTRFPPIESRLEALDNSQAYLQEANKQVGRNLSVAESALIELNKRWEPLETRIDLAIKAVTRTESATQGLTREQGEAQRQVKEALEQLRLSDYQRKQRLDDWQAAFNANQEEMARYQREWVRMADQIKVAEASISTLDEWRKQIELQQRESAELMRVELNRLRTAWQDFTVENSKQWKSRDVDSEQRWQAADRRFQQVLEQVQGLLEKLDRLDQERDALWRVQTAQADAIKRWPLLWLEEVEKALANNPNRRRQPALTPVREE